MDSVIVGCCYGVAQLYFRFEDADDDSQGRFYVVDRDSWLRGRWWKWVCWFLIIPTDSSSTVILNRSSVLLGRGIQNLSLFLSKQRHISINRVEDEVEATFVFPFPVILVVV